MTDIAARLAEHAVSLQPRDLPDEVVDRTKLLFLDLLGVGLRGSGRADSTGAIREGVRAIARPGEATVWGEREPLAAAHAALLNGSYAHTLDFDDTHRAGSVHPGAAVIPAALALGEVGHVDGPTLLAAVVAGYDVTCRIAMALDPGVHYDRGYHPTATAGHFGAAAAGGRVLGLTADQVRGAFGIGGSQAAGSLQFLANGAWNKRIHPGLAAHNAILALELARRGFLGAAEPFEGRWGLLRMQTDAPHPEEATAALGERFEVLRTGIKPYPACRYAHGPLDALIELATREDLGARDVAEVTVGLSDAAVDLIGKPAERKQRPESVVDAQFSMPFLASAALYRRRMSWDDYELVGDPSVTDLAGRVRVVADEEANRRFPEEWLAVIEITATDGRTWVERRSGARGEPETPLSWDEVRAKFLGLAGPIVGGEQAGALADLVERMERVTDLAEVGALLRPAGGSAGGTVETASMGGAG